MTASITLRQRLPLSVWLGQKLRTVCHFLAALGPANPADSAAQAAERTAERLLDSYGNAILRLAYSYLHNMADAEDILQETLLRCLQNAPAFESWEHEKAWLLLVGLRALPRGGELSGTPTSEGGVTMGSPIQEYGSLEALSAAAGFAVQQPENLPFEAEQTTYSLLFGELAQVEQLGPQGESILYRVSQEEGDNSGDYNTYSREEQQPLGDVSITLKGGGDGWQLAIWQRDGFSYSLSSSAGLTDAQVQAMLETVL